VITWVLKVHHEPDILHALTVKLFDRPSVSCCYPGIVKSNSG